MDAVTMQGTGAGGLATRGARWAILFACAMGGLKVVIDGQFTLSHPMLLPAYALLLASVILLTRTEDRPLSGAPAIAAPASALAATALVLIAAPEAVPIWMLHFASYMLALLFVRGNPVLGAFGIGGHVGLVTGWALAHGMPLSTLGQILAGPLVACAVSVIWQLALRRIVARERAYRSANAEHARQIDAERRAAEAVARELALVRSRTASVLARLRDGEPLDDGFRTDIAVIEGGVRDRIRSPRLQHPELDRAIAEARARGASVTVLADDSPGAPPLRDRPARELAAILRDEREAESLVIAWTEPARASILARRGEASTRRIVETGEGLERRRVG